MLNNAAPQILIAGIDEAGRGPLAGPVVAAAVILDPGRPISGLRDSKLLSAQQRERLAVEIRACALAWAVGTADVAEIDELNILQATLLAMRRAFAGLALLPSEAWTDGNRCPQLPCPARAIVKGDRDVIVISAASILAKTARDSLLIELDCRYPGYGFAQNKGYGTPAHLAALARMGHAPRIDARSRRSRVGDDIVALMIHCVLHDPHDSVAVVVVEGVAAGATLTGLILDEDRTITLRCIQDIPLGHKVALKDLAVGDTVIKYGVDIGKVVQPISKGQHAHVHNIKTKRW